jgi:ankyrin repeat protein
LLAHQANPNATNSWGGTAIFSIFGNSAPDYKPDEAVKLLVQAGANINLNLGRNELGWSGTPLHYAARAGKVAAAESLLTHGAPPNLIDQNGDTPLHLAIRNRQLPMVELLLKHKADVNIANKKGKTPLMLTQTGGFYQTTGSYVTNAAPNLEALLHKYGATESAKKSE